MKARRERREGVPSRASFTSSVVSISRVSSTAQLNCSVCSVPARILPEEKTPMSESPVPSPTSPENKNESENDGQRVGRSRSIKFSDTVKIADDTGLTTLTRENSTVSTKKNTKKRSNESSPPPPLYVLSLSVSCPSVRPSLHHVMAPPRPPRSWCGRFSPSHRDFMSVNA